MNEFADKVVGGTKHVPHKVCEPEELKKTIVANTIGETYLDAMAELDKETASAEHNPEKCVNNDMFGNKSSTKERNRDTRDGTFRRKERLFYSCKGHERTNRIREIEHRDRFRENEHRGRFRESEHRGRFQENEQRYRFRENEHRGRYRENKRRECDARGGLFGSELKEESKQTYLRKGFGVPSWLKGKENSAPSQLYVQNQAVYKDCDKRKKGKKNESIIIQSSFDMNFPGKLMANQSELMTDSCRSSEVWIPDDVIIKDNDVAAENVNGFDQVANDKNTEPVDPDQSKECWDSFIDEKEIVETKVPYLPPLPPDDSTDSSILECAEIQDCMNNPVPVLADIVENQKCGQPLSDGDKVDIVDVEKQNEISIVAESSSAKVYTWLNSKLADDVASASSDLTSHEMLSVKVFSQSDTSEVPKVTDEDFAANVLDPCLSSGSSLQYTGTDIDKKPDVCVEKSGTCEIASGKRYGGHNSNESSEGSGQVGGWYSDYEQNYHKLAEEYYEQWLYSKQALDWNYYYQQQGFVNRNDIEEYYCPRNAVEYNEHVYSERDAVDQGGHYEVASIDDLKVEDGRKFKTAHRIPNEIDVVGLEANLGGNYREKTGQGRYVHRADAVLGETDMNHVYEQQKYELHISPKEQEKNERNRTVGQRGNVDEPSEARQDKSEHKACICGPDDVCFFVMRICKCSEGNPPKLEKVLPKMAARLISDDHGYSSCESIGNKTYNNSFTVFSLYF